MIDETMMLVVFQTTKRTKFQYGKGINSKIGTVSQQPKLQRKWDEPAQSGRLFVTRQSSTSSSTTTITVSSSNASYFLVLYAPRVRRRLYSRACVIQSSFIASSLLCSTHWTGVEVPKQKIGKLDDVRNTTRKHGNRN
jgi:hypothetical protein